MENYEKLVLGEWDSNYGIMPSYCDSVAKCKRDIMTKFNDPDKWRLQNGLRVYMTQNCGNSRYCWVLLLLAGNIELVQFHIAGNKTNNDCYTVCCFDYSKTDGKEYVEWERRSNTYKDNGCEKYCECNLHESKLYSLDWNREYPPNEKMIEKYYKLKMLQE